MYFGKGFVGNFWRGTTYIETNIKNIIHQNSLPYTLLVAKYIDAVEV